MYLFLLSKIIQIQENFIQYARQTDNLYSLAYMLGYTPKVTSAANAEIYYLPTVPAIVVNRL